MGTVSRLALIFCLLLLNSWPVDLQARGRGGGGSYKGGHSRGDDTHVRGYTRRDGTYVQPHKRTAPNSSRRDNYSTRGNVNPYTGKPGTVDPNK